jgi:hypothetical protein
LGGRMDKAQFLAEIRDERARLEGVVAQVGGAAMDEPGVVGQWSPKDVLAHIAFWERTFLGWIEAATLGRMPDMPAPGLTWEDVDLLNDRVYRESRVRALDDVRDEFAASYHPTLALVESTDEGTLFDPERNPLGPRLALWQYAAANTSEHYREHRESLEAWLLARNRTEK